MAAGSGVSSNRLILIQLLTLLATTSNIYYMGSLGLISLFSALSIQFGLPPKVLQSLCMVESSFNVNAIHHDDGGEDSIGVCQVKLSTAKWLGFKGNKTKLMAPRVNAYYAAKYLRYNLKRYGSIEKAVIAYNRGNAKGLTKTKYSDKVFTVLRKAAK